VTLTMLRLVSFLSTRLIWSGAVLADSISLNDAYTKAQEPKLRGYRIPSAPKTVKQVSATIYPYGRRSFP
jgi:hypothetical protein